MPSAETGPLVGREPETRRLDRVVRRATDGAGPQVVVLSGEAGIGKSRLARHTLDRARAAGHTTLAGASGPLQRDLSFAPVVEALRPLVREGGAARRASLLDGLSDLGRLFDGLGLPPAAPLGDAGLERTRLHEAICRLLQRACDRAPVTVLVDDVQWADPASLSVLHYLVRGLAGRPFLLLLTYRGRTAEPPDAAAQFVDALRRSGVATELALGGLDRLAVAALAGSVLGGDAPDALVAMLHDRAGGVPLFVEALVEALVDEGALRRDGRSWRLVAVPTVVPDVVESLLRHRVEALPAPARAVLDLCALCPGIAPHAVLCDVLADDAVVVAGVTVLRDTGLLAEELVDGRVAYRVTHPMLGEVAHALLPAVVRHERHAAVARALSRLGPADVRLLAHHVRGAGTEMDPAQAHDILVAAADGALARTAGDEAVTNARAAIELGHRAGRGTDPGLLDRLAEGAELAGRGGDALDTWRDAAAGSDDARERSRRLRRAAVVAWDLGRFDECWASIDAAVAAVRDDLTCPELLAALTTRARLGLRGDPLDRRDDSAAEVLRAVAAIRTPEAEHVVRYADCDALLRAGRYYEAREVAETLRASAAELGSDLVTEISSRPPTMLAVNLGDLDDARRWAWAGLGAARRIGVPSLEAVHLFHLGLAEYLQGRWDRAGELAAEVVEVAERVDHRRGIALGHGVAALLHTGRGDLPAAASAVARAQAAYGPWARADRRVFGLVELAVARLALASGDAATAASSLSVADHYSAMPLLRRTLGEAQALCGDLDAAAGTASEARGLGPGAPHPAAAADTVDGFVRRGRGDHAGAAEAFGRAAQTYSGLGMVVDQATSRLEELDARLDARSGEAEAPPDPVWTAHATAALETLRTIGARPAADHARQVLRRLGERPAPAPAAGRDRLSPREEQVARLVAEGLSNTEIAGRLFISQRTVTTHLQHVYGRLGITSRTALARYVVEALPGPNT